MCAKLTTSSEALKSLAYHDPLTGLPNRLLFHDRLSQAVERARRSRQMLAVMLVDLDRFKLINDSLGLEKGDQVLKAAGDRLAGALRKSDTVARLGGDEFMVLVLGTTGAEAAAKVAQKLLDSLRPPLTVNGHELTTAASLGLALLRRDPDQERRLGPVPGEGAGPQPLPVLYRRHERGRVRAADAREPAAQGPGA